LSRRQFSARVILLELLARLFARPANLLPMDEPTNDLDIDALELFEEYVADFAGTLQLVSHDRAFLDHVVTSLLVFEGDGVAREFVGDYSDWSRYRLRHGQPRASHLSDSFPAASAPAAAAAARASSRTRISASWWRRPSACRSSRRTSSASNRSSRRIPLAIGVRAMVLRTRCRPG
jgi:ATP-binding cassette subfamily F protein uup